MGAVEGVLQASQEIERKTAEEMAARALYKIQVFCHSKRSVHTNLVFSLSVWKSGKRLHEGGDESMFLCWRQQGAADVVPLDEVTVRREKKRGCKGLIPASMQQGGAVVCPSCMAYHRVNDIGDTIFYSVPVTDAADILAEWWTRAGGSADVVLKYAPFDIRAKAAKPGELRKAKETRAVAIYPLANILKDTNTGATLASRFKALLLF